MQAGFHRHFPAQFLSPYRWILRSRPLQCVIFRTALVVVTNAWYSDDAPHRRTLVWDLFPPFGYRILHRIATRGAYPICPHLFDWLTGWTQGVSHPVRVNQIPRQIPPAPRYLQPWVCRRTCNV